MLIESDLKTVWQERIQLRHLVSERPSLLPPDTVMGSRGKEEGTCRPNSTDKSSRVYCAWTAQLVEVWRTLILRASLGLDFSKRFSLDNSLAVMIGDMKLVKCLAKT